MPAPIEVITAYERAKKDGCKAAEMLKEGIDRTVQYWATATDEAKDAVKAFLLPPPHTA